MAATESAVSVSVLPVLSKLRKIKHVNSSVATVIPEIGFDDEPISPVSREDTVTNRNPKITISAAANNPCQLKPSPRLGIAVMARTRAMLPASVTQMGKSRSVRLTTGLPSPSRGPAAVRSRNPAITEPKISGSAGAC